MSALSKYVTFLGLALAISLCVFGSLSFENIVLAPAKPEAAVAAVDPAAAAAIDEELDYRIAQRVRSLEGWRSFLAAHAGGAHAQAARAEMEKLLLAEKAPGAAEPEAAVAPVDPAGAAAIDEELDYRTAQKVGSLDGWRSFLAAYGSGIHAQAARAEVEKLLLAEKDPAPAKPEAAVAPVDLAGAAAIDEELVRSLTAHASGAQAASAEAEKLILAEKAPAPAKPEAAVAAIGATGAAAIDKELDYRNGQRVGSADGYHGSGVHAPAARPEVEKLLLAETAPAPASTEPPTGANLNANAAGAVPTSAFSGGYEDGAAAYNRGEFATAKRLWLPLAEQGDARAQLGLAVMYFLGQGVQVHIAAALEWCQKAADQGLAAAQYELGHIFEHPRRPELQNFAEAVKWYRRAADQGYAEAQDELGGMYEFGLGMPRDYTMAEKWFGKAGDLVSIANMYDAVAAEPRMATKWYRRLADQGDEYAQFRLGEMYRDGEGAPQDFVSAYVWFNLAASSGYLSAAIARDELARKMIPDQVAKAERFAREWKPSLTKTPMNVDTMWSRTQR